MSAFFAQSDLKTSVSVVRFLDCSLTNGTYDAMYASGDLVVEQVNILVSVGCATFTSVSIQSDNAPAQVIMTSQEGAVANLTNGANVGIASTNKSFIMRGGNKLRYTIAGSQGTGQLMLCVKYRPLTEGSILG